MRQFDRRVGQTLPEVRPALAALAAVGLAQGIVAVAQAVAVAHLVDAVVRVGAPQAPDLGFRAVALASGVFAVRALLGALGERWTAAAGIRVSSAVRVRLLRRWLAVPAEQRPTPTTALTLAAQGATSIEPYVARFLPALVGAVVLPVLVVAAIAAVDWVSALVVVVTVPLLPLFAALIGRATQDSTSRRWAALRALSGHFLDVVRGLPTLVAYGRAQRQAETVGAVSERHRAATMQTLRLAFLSSAALELLATVSVALVAVTVGLRLAGGSLDLAPGLTAILLAPEAYWPIRRVGTEYHNAADGAEALADALDELDHLDGSAHPLRTERGPGPHGRSEFGLDGVSYTYPHATDPVLVDLDLDLPGTGLLVVTGPSGAGKSTLLDVLAGARRPTRGVVRAPRSHLVTQRPLLVPASVRANLALGVGRPVDDADVWTALERVGLGADLRAAGGLDTWLGDDGFGLSAGQRARLALARALLSDARLILLDEPTAHLDTAAAAVVHDVIRRLAAQRCVVVVTHRAELFESGALAGQSPTTLRLAGRS